MHGHHDGPLTWRQVEWVWGEVGWIEGVSDVDLPLAADGVVERVHELVRRVHVVLLVDIVAAGDAEGRVQGNETVGGGVGEFDL